MKILFLGHLDSPIYSFLKSKESFVYQTLDKLDLNFLIKEKFDFLVSYRYKHIIKKDVLDLFPNKAINLHISLLPWNKGTNPVFWSFFENTPKGITIHHIDDGIDTGPIIIQKKIKLTNDETLRTAYQKLSKAIEELFIDNWEKIKQENCPKIKQKHKGSLHNVKQKEKFDFLLTEGWDTRVQKLINYQKTNKISS